MKCELCPRECRVDREKAAGYCKAAKIKLSRVGLHFYEEPCISGKNGSGTVFFAGCNMRCVFCQNRAISFDCEGVEVDESTLEKVFFSVNDSPAENINLVSPSQFSDVIARILSRIKHKLTKPIIYNTNSFEKVSSLKRLDGLVDVYLPDFKYCSDSLAEKYSDTKGYFAVAHDAVTEMRRQQKTNVICDGLIKKGVIVRLLVLPSCVEDAKLVLDDLAKIDKMLTVSIMAQYFPPRQMPFSELMRRVSKREYDQVCDYFFALGLTNGYCQDAESAVQDYVPDFDVEKLKQYLESIK